MPLNVQKLEELLARLRNLADRLQSGDLPSDKPLEDDHPLVRMAHECDFLMPRPLTVGTLAATVERKIGNVLVLLERARQHEEIPADAQAAAENEDNLVEMALRPSARNESAGTSRRR